MNGRWIRLFSMGFTTVFALAMLGCGTKAPQGAQEDAQTGGAASAAAADVSGPTAAPEETQAPAPETVTFEAADGLKVTADLYLCGKANAPFILLFHQARYSRGEYLEIAPKLCAWGYDCLAVDQRSGGTSNGVANETYLAAKAAKMTTNYADAYPDLEAALQYVIGRFAPEELIVWGSSYSASLVLILASEHPQEIDAALAFSPGEYFHYQDQKVASFAAKITQPVFITSAKSEEKDWRPIADQIPSEGCVFFVPEGNGVHGSSTLYEAIPNHQEYWDAVEGFLSSLRGA